MISAHGTEHLLGVLSTHDTEWKWQTGFILNSICDKCTLLDCGGSLYAVDNVWLFDYGLFIVHLYNVEYNQRKTDYGKINKLYKMRELNKRWENSKEKIK